MIVPRSVRLSTPRLVLRPSEADDAARAFEIQSNWNVTRNLRLAAFPPDRADLAVWFASHESEWLAGTEYRFAILLDGHMIGLIDLDNVRDRMAEIGYWLDEPSWGQGFAFEAGQAVVRFARNDLNLAGLRSGHAADNPASGRVLEKLGFRYINQSTVPSRARGGDIVQKRYAMVFADPLPQTS